MKLFILLFFLIPNIVFSNEINEKFEKLFDLTLTSDSIKNRHYLTKPSYILAFMRLNNFFITNHYEVELINDKSFRIGFAILNFIKYENNNFFFNVSIEGVGNADVLLAIDNASRNLNILIEKNFKERLPSNLIMRVQRKLSSIFSIKSQNELNYMFNFDLDEFGSLEKALIIGNFNNKNNLTAGFSASNLSGPHKFQLLSIFLIIFILMLFRNRIIRKP
jgi:hypothetical protein